jgi:hypothetical protein
VKNSMKSARCLLVSLFFCLLLWVCAACKPPLQAVGGEESLHVPAISLSPTETYPSSSSISDDAATDTSFLPEPTSLQTLEINPPLSIPSTLSPTPSVIPTLAPKAWRTAPVIPTLVNQRMLEIYQQGQLMGNDPHAFSKVGDCQTMLPDFFGGFDNGKYNLGDYTYLQPVVDQFSGSFGRNSRGVKNGMTASGAMATLWNTWKDCNLQETPLECEYRINNPSFAIISLGTNDANGLLPFEYTLRRVIELTLEHGIVPILVTKADNAEGDWSINATIMKLAYEYQIPVWNFWRAVQSLPGRGLRSPEHLTFGEYTQPTDFSNTENMQYGYNVRNLTGLQALDVVWRSVTGQPMPDFVPTPVTFLP